MKTLNVKDLKVGDLVQRHGRPEHVMHVEPLEWENKELLTHLTPGVPDFYAVVVDSGAEPKTAVQSRVHVFGLTKPETTFEVLEPGDPICIVCAHAGDASFYGQLGAHEHTSWGGYHEGAGTSYGPASIIDQKYLGVLAVSE